MRQHALGQHLAQLHALLVKAVQVPRKALEHDLVLKVRQQRAERLRGQLLADDDAGGTAAGEVLVAVVVGLAAGEGDDLRGDVRAQLLLAGAALNDDVGRHLTAAEADELQRHDVRALVQQLIEGVLAVGARLAEDDGAGHIIHRLAKAVDGLAVGLHVQLLQVRREAAERLGIRQHGGVRIAEHVALVHADQRVEHGRILQQILVFGELVRLGSALEELREDLRTERQGQHRAADGGGGGVAAADEVVHKEGGEIIGALGQRRGLAGDGDHVLGGVKARLGQRVLDEGLVGQRLQRRAGLGDEHEQRVRHVDFAEHARRVVGVDVADELCLHLERAVDPGPVLQRQVHRAGAQVAAADADLHDGGELLARGVGDLAGVHLAGQLRDAGLLLDIEGALVDAVGDHRLAQLAAAQVMQHAAVFAGVDDRAVVQLGKLLGQLRFLGKLCEGRENGVVHRTRAEVEIKPRAHRHGIAAHALRAVFTGHHARELHLLRVQKGLIRGQGIHILPSNHGQKPPQCFAHMYPEHMYTEKIILAIRREFKENSRI